MLFISVLRNLEENIRDFFNTNITDQYLASASLNNITINTGLLRNCFIIFLDQDVTRYLGLLKQS